MSSFWLDSISMNNSFMKLDKDIDTEVCVIGGGIFGITCAYYLSKQGIDVTVLEQGKVCEKVSGYTTAKITSQHNLIYKYLIDSVGEEQAKQYYKANEKAIENIQRIVEDEGIDCDFEKQDAFVYTTDIDELDKIKHENEAVNSLGGTSEFVERMELPFDVLGAIKFPNQAQFNPVKYVRGLTDKIVENQGKIYTDTKVIDIKMDEDFYNVYTERENVVRAKFVIIASHYPFVDKLGYYFLKMYQSTSYVIGVDIHKKGFEGMYINSKDPIFSYRFAKDGDRDILLVGGSDHKTGSKIDLSKAYDNLEMEVRKYYPNCEVLYKWNTEDCIS